MDSKPQKPALLFTNPFSLWTELAFKLWGFGKVPEKQVAVAVIPTSDAKPPTKPARAKAKVRTRRKGKRAARR